MTSMIPGGAIVLADITLIPLLVFVLLVAGLIVAIRHQLRVRARRRHLIETYRWPPRVIDRLKRRHPTLTPPQIEDIDRALRQFFTAYLTGGQRYVSMPSVAADALWHEFMLDTREYKAFCYSAFGRLLRHRPPAVLTRRQKQSNEGLRRVWWHTCKLEGIDPRAANALPLLFALDGRLNIPNGHVYHPDCDALRRDGAYGGQCGGDFVSLGFDGTTDGMGDGDGGGGGDGGGCGGGD